MLFGVFQLSAALYYLYAHSIRDTGHQRLRMSFSHRLTVVEVLTNYSSTIMICVLY